MSETQNNNGFQPQNAAPAQNVPQFQNAVPNQNFAQYQNAVPVQNVPQYQNGFNTQFQSGWWASLPAKSLAKASLVCGIVTVVFCWLPTLAIITGVFGIVLALLAAKAGFKGGIFVGGLTTSILGFIIAEFLAIYASIFVATSIYEYEYEDEDEEEEETSYSGKSRALQELEEIEKLDRLLRMYR